nr:hypothetical protein [Actinophytocola sp.]
MRVVAGVRGRRVASLPGHRQVVAPADVLEARGEKILDPLQVFVVGGFCAQRQRVLGGVQSPLAPGQPDDPVRVGPFDVPHLGRRVRVAGARPVA